MSYILSRRGTDHWYTTTTFFIAPILDLPIEAYSPKHMYNCYLGKGTLSKNELYCLFTKETPERVLSELRNHIRFREEHPNPNYHEMSFTLTEDDIKKVVNPVVDSTYSAIDINYVGPYFSSLPGGLRNSTYSIITRQPHVKHKMELDLDMPLPEDAELWSRFNPEEEVLR